MISITDGQISLSADLFNSGLKPGIEVGLSFSRVGSSAQWDGMKAVGGTYKLDLAQFNELQAFSQFASDLGDKTKATLDRGQRLVELLKQDVGRPFSLPSMVSLLSIASQGIVACVSLSQLRAFVLAFTSLPAWVFLFVPGRLMFTAVADDLRLP